MHRHAYLDWNGVRVVAAHGEAATDLIGRTFPSGTLSEKVMTSGRGLLVERVTRSTEVSEQWQAKVGPGMVAPLAGRHDPIGALGFGGRYGRRPYGVDDLNMATHFASGAGMAVELAKSRKDRERRLETTAQQLQQALDSRVIIEEAKGYLAAVHGVTVDAAFDLIRAYARSHQLTVQSVARQVIDRSLLV